MTAESWNSRIGKVWYTKQRFCKHVPAVTKTDRTEKKLLHKKHIAIKELLEVVFSMQHAPILYTGVRNGVAVTLDKGEAYS
jgi:hypothetical protein